MMLSVFLVALLAAPALGFNIVNSRKVSSMTMMAEKSKALPFLDRPAALDGSSVGDFGFDPLGFTNTLPNLYYVKAAEIKHGRVAMLAVVGFIFQQYVHILTPEANPFKAIGALGYGPNLQILSFIGVIELATWSKTFFGDAPGDLGFDPLNQLKGKSASDVNTLKLKELKNGRLAMIAIIGLFVQNLAFDGASSL